MDDPVITTREAAALLGVSVRTAQGWVENGALDSWKTPGGHRRVRRSSVLAMLDRAKPSTAARSAVVVVASRERLPLYMSGLEATGECATEFFDDPFAALLAIGTLLPAIIVIELDDVNLERFAMLRRIADDPSLGHTHILAISNLPREVIRERGGVNANLRLLSLFAVESGLSGHVSALLASPVPSDKAHGPRKVPVLLNESDRVAAVYRTGLLDTAPEDEFDRLTWLASQILHTPMALITLLTGTRQWFKSHYGTEMTETPRDWAFCSYAILQKNMMVVEDATLDSRFASNPMVLDNPKVRFYAGVPLIGEDGFALGTFCVIDTEPRKLDETQAQMLIALAAIATDEILARIRKRELRWAQNELQSR